MNNMDYTKATVKTPFGLMEYWSCNENHFCISAHSIQVNGVPMNVRMDFQREEFLIWGPKTSETDRYGYHALYCSRSDFKEPSQVAKKKIRTVLTEFVNKFASDHPELFHVSKINDRQDKLERLQENKVKFLKELDAINLEIISLTDELADELKKEKG